LFFGGGGELYLENAQKKGVLIFGLKPSLFPIFFFFSELSEKVAFAS